MAATGYTPISLYYSSTASTVPLAANLVAGELALNTNDGKLYFKNSSGVVTLLASGATAINSISFGSTGLTPATSTTGAVTVAGFEIEIGILHCLRRSAELQLPLQRGERAVECPAGVAFDHPNLPVM